MTWLVVVAVVAAVVVRYELFVRSRGYRPSIKDDEYAWAWQRASVSDGSRHTVALLGSSRIMLAFSSDAFEAELPGWHHAQLGINGTTPIGALWDLARDPDFRGIAIVDASEPAFYRVSWEAQDRYIAAYHRRWRAVGAMAERALSTSVQSRLALLATRGLHTLGKLWRTGRWPKPPYVTTLPDRTRFADFSLTDVERQRSGRVEAIKSFETTMGPPEPWLAEALQIEPAVAAIQARGGNVVYVRMPTCDERWTYDEQQAPKATYWDKLADRTKAVTVHFKDDPVLASFPCPDTSHIAGRDAPAFTRRLLQLLRERHALAVD